MAARVYDLPEHLPAPEFAAFMKDSGGMDVDGYFEACKEHTKTVAEWCRQNSGSRSELVGETISFPVADGKAEYMVFRTTPLELIHLPYVDAYEADPILLRGLRVADVKQLVRQRQARAEIFGTSTRRRS